MVAIFGMDEKIGNVSFYDMQNQNQFSKPYSEETGRMIDEESRSIIEHEYKRAGQLLKDKKELLDQLAQELLSKEVLFKDDLEKMLGKRPWDKEAEPVVPPVSNNLNTDTPAVENTPVWK